MATSIDYREQFYGPAHKQRGLLRPGVPTVPAGPESERDLDSGPVLITEVRNGLHPPDAEAAQVAGPDAQINEIIPIRPMLTSAAPRRKRSRKTSPGIKFRHARGLMENHHYNLLRDEALGRPLPSDFAEAYRVVPGSRSRTKNMIRSDLLGDYGVESEEEIPDDLSYRLYKVTLSQLHETHLLVNYFMLGNWQKALTIFKSMWSPPSTSEDQWEFLFGPPGAIVHDLMWVAVLHNQIQAVEALTPWIAFVGVPELQDLELRIVSTWAIIAARLGYLDIADRLFKLKPCKQAVRDENAETFDEICRAAQSGVQSSLQDGSRRSHSNLSRGSYSTSQQYQHEMESAPVDQLWKTRWSDRVLLRELKLPENLSLAPESLVGVTVISIPASFNEDEASIEPPSEDEQAIEEPREERTGKRQRH